jgi:hypothetical protein
LDSCLLGLYRVPIIYIDLYCRWIRLSIRFERWQRRSQVTLARSPRPGPRHVVIQYLQTSFHHTLPIVDAKLLPFNPQLALQLRRCLRKMLKSLFSFELPHMVHIGCRPIPCDAVSESAQESSHQSHLRTGTVYRIT